jgi:acid stress chaperone HdeB
LLVPQTAANVRHHNVYARFSREQTKATIMRFPVMLAVAAALVTSAPAQAEKFDLSTITCKKFFEYNKENLSLLLTWLEGYYADEDADPVIDFEQMADNAKRLGEFCAKNPTIGVITATEKIYGNK